MVSAGHDGCYGSMLGRSRHHWLAKVGNSLWWRAAKTLIVSFSEGKNGSLRWWCCYALAPWWRERRWGRSGTREMIDEIKRRWERRNEEKKKDVSRWIIWTTNYANLHWCLGNYCWNHCINENNQYRRKHWNNQCKWILTSILLKRRHFQTKIGRRSNMLFGKL